MAFGYSKHARQVIELLLKFGADPSAQNNRQAAPPGSDAAESHVGIPAALALRCQRSWGAALQVPAEFGEEVGHVEPNPFAQSLAMFHLVGSRLASGAAVEDPLLRLGSTIARQWRRCSTADADSSLGSLADVWSRSLLRMRGLTSSPVACAFSGICSVTLKPLISPQSNRQA